MENADNGRVIVITDGTNTEVWGSLTELCKSHGLSYNYLKRFKYPFNYRGVSFQRLNFRSKPNNGHVVFKGK